MHRSAAYIRLRSFAVDVHLALIEHNRVSDIIQFKTFPRFVSMPGRKQVQI